MQTSVFKTLNVILVADRTYQGYDEVDANSNRLEMIPDEYFYDIYNVLKELCKTVTHCQTPEQLADHRNADKHSIVFTVYGGFGSRNRMALVPAVCEAFNIQFAGGDAYARIICQDKFLSKKIAEKYSVPSPEGILFDKGMPEDFIRDLKLPLVVKPNFEGSSIGINPSNKVSTYEDAIAIAYELINAFRQPVVVEEFVVGKEVCICIVGNQKGIKLFEVVEVYYEHDEMFFYNTLYGAYEKHVSDMVVRHRVITDELEGQQKSNILSLYNALGKMDFMRIDGRVENGRFTMIELTPDGYIGKESSFLAAAKSNGKDYTALLADILSTALEYYQTPYSSYTES